MFDWLRSHEVLLGWLGAASAIMFFGSLLAVPWLVIKMPEDYFSHQTHLVDRWRIRHPLLRTAFLIAKNLFGVVLVISGIAMLILPGQGILTIAVGVMCLDFPGKLAIERRLAADPWIIGPINWIRVKAKRRPLTPSAFKTARK